MKKNILLVFFLLFKWVSFNATAQKKIFAISNDTLAAGKHERQYWVAVLQKISYPVIHNLAEGTLKKNMPVIESLIYRKEFNSASFYICPLGFMAPGLPSSDNFWTGPASDWTSKRAWSGQPFQKDYHVDY